MSSNTLALCQQSLSVLLTPQNYDYLRSSHHCRLGHERLPNSIKIHIKKRVLPDDKVHDGGETDSPGNRSWDLRYRKSPSMKDLARSTSCVHAERACPEYILCTCTPPALQPPLWSLTSPISSSLLLLHPQIIWIHLTSTDQINSNRILLLHGRS